MSKYNCTNLNLLANKIIEVVRKMEQLQISRSDLRYNFLKNIIVRLDFQGIVDSEIEHILPIIKPYVKSKGFNRFEEKTNSQISFEIKGNLLSEEVPSKNIKNQKIFSFINDEKGITLDLSSDFICININTSKYIPFEIYCNTIVDIAKIIREQIDFFTVKRLGIRKINICLVDSKELVLKYFSKERFGYYTGIIDIDTIASQKKDLFRKDSYQVNLSCGIEQGRMDDKELFKVTVDIDLYMDDKQAIIAALEDFSILKGLNEVLFSIYTDTLTKELKQALCSNEDFAINSILGVERNE